jgi:hypothetical protein
VGTSTAKGPDQNFQSSNKRVTAPLTEITNSVVPAEGQSSLTAHTTFAIDFAHNIVGSDQRRGRHSQEIGTLLDTLRHIGNAFNDQRLHSKPLFPLVESTASLNHDEYDMPPLRAAVHVLRQAQGMFTTTSLSARIDCLLQIKGISYYLPYVICSACKICQIFA